MSANNIKNVTETFDSINAPQFFDFSKNPFEQDNDDTFFDMVHEENSKPKEEEDPLKFEIHSRDLSQSVKQGIDEFVSLDETFEEHHQVRRTMTMTVGHSDLVLAQSSTVKYENENLQDTLQEHHHCRRTMTMTVVDSNLDFAQASTEQEREILELEDNPLFRRSMSVGDIVYLQAALDNASIRNGNKRDSVEESVFNDSKENTVKEMKKENVRTELKYSLDAPPSRAASKDSLNRLAQPKRHYGSEQSLSKNSYVSMAEAVKKFQNSTPERFRTKPKPESSGACALKIARTIPQSPHLVASKRNRPVNAVSHEEQERLDFEEARKFKIKAHPVNKKVLLGPLKPTVPIERKPTTVPEPFKLTEVQPRVIKSPQVEHHTDFHANPVPEFNKKKPSATDYQKKLTKPQTPNVLKRYQRKMGTPQPPQQPQAEKKPVYPLPNTRPLPFSFEARDKYLKKKKEDFINKVLEEEKKAREFHARPVPKRILATSRNSSMCQEPRARTKSEDNLTTEFKAKPATVLYKKPFEPKKEEKPLTEISEFTLNTDLRAKERELFEQQKKEKEEKIAVRKHMEDMMKLQQEKEEVFKIRKMAEYKAQPVKKYKEVTIQPSGKVTLPISPKFHTVKNRNKNDSRDKENLE